MTTLALILLTLSSAQAATGQDAAVQVTDAEAVGWHLFFDKLLSRPETFSCESCHRPETGFADGLPRAEGVYGDVLPRHTPRLANLRDATAFFWDGRAATLEEQALSPLTDRREMDLTADEIVARVAAQPHYRRAFSALGVDEIRLDDVLGAIAAFVRGLETGETVFDRWLAGDTGALDEAEQRGRMLFFTRGQCATCHIGPQLTDHAFHNVGTGTESDPGRFRVTGEERDLGRFKTPSLRNWNGTEPFLHDGRFATIREVLDHYSEPEATVVGESELDPLDLDDSEKDDLLAFLETLDGASPDLSPHEARWEELTSP
jgi:cytochrome c peroxidase